MFSVIIPVYNQSTYIEKCLQSVFDQTFQEFEVIVVNDGSTDDGSEKIEKFRLQDSRFKVVNQANEGVSVARNNGVKAAKYDYIAFLDADDWWEKDFLGEMKCLIEDFPEAGIYGSGYYLIKNGHRRVAPIGIDNDFKKGIINYFSVYAKNLCMPLTSISVVMRKEVFFSEGGFKPILKLGEDFDLWLRIALKHTVAFLNKPLADYNQDVELNNRAVGKLHDPENHILFNLEFLKEEEKAKPELKHLLDNLRVYGLLPYYLSDEYRLSALSELKKVDWSSQPGQQRLLYHTPVFLLKFRQQFLLTGSQIKQRILKSSLFIKGRTK
jgi:glycosyltransferase involved in cell wall biosynthesis